MEYFSSYTYPETDQRVELCPYAKEYLLKTIDLCEQENIQLGFVKMPHIADENDIALLNEIEAIASEHGIDFLDFCRQTVQQSGSQKSIFIERLF